MNSIPKLLSKTKLLKGYRCQKCLYLTVHEPSLEAAITPETQALFDQGNRVGAEARKYYPNGVLVNNKPWDFGGALARTRELLANNTPVIYEAAFEYAGCYARADILQYSESTNRWRIFEVKSSTKVKPEHIDDTGLQAWIIAKSGLPIEQINIVHLNPDCRYPDLSNLFTTVDITAEIREKYLSIQPKLLELFTSLRQNQVPLVDIGTHCTTPTECGFKQHCWQQKQIPEFSIFDLPGLQKKQWDLYRSGIIRLDDERLNDLTELQERIITCFKTGERFLDPAGVRSALSTWRYPLVFLDFETINPAIPCYPGRGPFQQVPFQFSVHRLETPNSPLTHHAFLHETTDDPRPTLIPALLSACGKEGSIVAYYSTFEGSRIQELAEFSPPHAAALNELITRLVDPLPIIRAHIYDHGFAGSFSLKNVAPALLGEAHSYTNMAVANGNDAQRAFLELISSATSAEKKAVLKQNMLDYCNKDTLVMVELVKWLYQV